MRNGSFLAAGAFLAWTSVVGAYSPLIQTTRDTLPKRPTITVAIKGEKDDQVELLITLSAGKPEPVDPKPEKELDQAEREKLDFDPKVSAARAFRHLNSVRAIVSTPAVLGGKKYFKTLTLLGISGEETLEDDEEPYKKTAERLAPDPEEAHPGERPWTIPRDSLGGAVVQFDCRQGGLAGPTYQVRLTEYLDEDSQKLWKEWRSQIDPKKLLEEAANTLLK